MAVREGVRANANEASDGAKKSMVDRRNIMRELAKLNVDSPKTARENLKNTLDVADNRKEKFFGSGKYTLLQKDVDDVKSIEQNIVLASVDSDGFAMKWHEPDWYRDYLDSAKALSGAMNLLDEPTKAWVQTLSPVLEGFTAMADLSPRDFKRNYKNEIWKLVKAYGKESVYSAKGILNLLLAVSRIRKSGVDLADPKLKTIKLVLGTGKDVSSKAKERFVVVMKEGVGAKEPNKVPEVVPPVEEPKPPVVAPDFYTKYEIAEKQRVSFDAKIQLFDSWLDDPEKMKLLNDPNLFKMKAGEPQAAFDTRMSKLFDSDTGEIKLLTDDLEAFVFLYEKFMQDTTNPKSVEVGKLYLDSSKRMIEYAGSLVSDAAQRDLSLLRYNQGIVEGCGQLKGVDSLKKGVLKQLVASTDYLAKNDPNDGDDGKVKWKRLNQQYQAELGSL